MHMNTFCRCLLPLPGRVSLTDLHLKATREPHIFQVSSTVTRMTPNRTEGTTMSGIYLCHRSSISENYKHQSIVNVKRTHNLFTATESPEYIQPVLTTCLEQQSFQNTAWTHNLFRATELPEYSLCSQYWPSTGSLHVGYFRLMSQTFHMSDQRLKQDTWNKSSTVTMISLDRWIQSYFIIHCRSLLALNDETKSSQKLFIFKMENNVRYLF